VLQAIAGYDPRDFGSSRRLIPEYASFLEADVGGLTIGVERGFFFSDRVWSDVRDAVDGVIDELTAQGARIVDVQLPEIDKMSPVGMTILLAEGSAYNRGSLRAAADSIDLQTRVMLELGEMVPATHYVLAQRARSVLKAALKNLFRAHDLDAFIAPTLPTTTMSIDRVMQPDETGEAPLSSAIHYMLPANVTGQPALTAPCGFSAEGLPIGYQLTGRPFDETTLFRLARAYERNHDWERRKPLT
jgi:aspartyl-tRNA(Asn)/glutamyl-tRNA(Gln) amidotransferase subunit A